jgi:ribonucleoside-diphosphate reductase alpha chain
VHSSNLCTEILLNTSLEEQAVCNLGSVNLVAHIRDGRLDETLLADTVRTSPCACWTTSSTSTSTPPPKPARPTSSTAPWAWASWDSRTPSTSCACPYDSDAAVDFADTSMELISYHAILASTHLAAERGAYQSFKGSLWDKGILPIDSIGMLADQRGGPP